MRELHVEVNNKIATYLARDGDLVCGNSDYVIVFSFDSEWDEYTTKTARFIWNDKYIDIPFSGDSVSVPVMSNITQLIVGVYAGNLATTTPAIIPCVLSVLCRSAGLYEDEAEEDSDDTPTHYYVPLPTVDDDGKILIVESGVYTLKTPEEAGVSGGASYPSAEEKSF